MTTHLRKAVFPVAGLGTRMFPASKSIPKEMLTLVDKPVIEWVVDEARDAGIEEFIFITSRNKSSIEDHFDSNFELDQAFARKGSLNLLKDQQKQIPEPGKIMFTRQQKPLGLGHAIWCARHAVGNEAFAVLLPDMVMRSESGCLAEMVDAMADRHGNMVATLNVPKSDVSKYGIVDLQGNAAQMADIHAMVEKPTVERAPSTAAIAGRYILQPEIFEILAHQAPGAGGEIQLTDALQVLHKSQPFWAYRFEGQTFDCGDKLGLLQANATLALDHPELGKPFRRMLEELLDDEVSVPLTQAKGGSFR
jgi:UTP--glucose-1-phosphate uridylyltransferase